MPPQLNGSEQPAFNRQVVGSSPTGGTNFRRHVMSTKEKAIAIFSDSLTNFVYYGIKNDEDLSQEELDKAVEDGKVTIEDMCKHFERFMKDNFSK